MHFFNILTAVKDVINTVKTIFKFTASNGSQITEDIICGKIIKTKSHRKIIKVENISFY